MSCLRLFALDWTFYCNSNIDICDIYEFNRTRTGAISSLAYCLHKPLFKNISKHGRNALIWRQHAKLGVMYCEWRNALKLDDKNL